MASSFLRSFFILVVGVGAFLAQAAGACPAGCTCDAFAVACPTVAAGGNCFDTLNACLMQSSSDIMKCINAFNVCTSATAANPTGFPGFSTATFPAYSLPAAQPLVLPTPRPARSDYVEIKVNPANTIACFPPFASCHNTSCKYSLNDPSCGACYSAYADCLKPGDSSAPYVKNCTAQWIRVFEIDQSCGQAISTGCGTAEVVAAQACNAANVPPGQPPVVAGFEPF